MSKEIGLSDKLNFEEIDLTAPDLVIREMLDQLPQETMGMVCGNIQKYDGPVRSYIKKGISSISIALGGEDQEVDIQDDLGKIGTEVHKYECYLYTPTYEKYRYRMFFVQYNLSNYPVTLVLEKTIAKSIFMTNGDYICNCSNRIELEELIRNILTSKRAISVMQELIRINQTTKATLKTDNEDGE